MIDLFKVFIPDTLDMTEVKNIIFSGQLTSGKYLKKFESFLQDFIGNPYLLVTSDNTYASLITLSIIGLKNDDEVISSPMSCLASNMPVLHFGAKIIWADIDPKTGTLCPDSVKSKITSKTKAIIHYHWGGFPGFIDEINEIGHQNNIPIIDDSIEAFGSLYKGKLIGNLGTDFTMFSFQTVRLPNSINGGAIAFNNKTNYENALKMRDFGIERKTFRDKSGEISKLSDISINGFGAMMNEINAFIGYEVIKRTESLIAQQRINSIYWNEYCDINNLQPLNWRLDTNPNYWIYSFLSDNSDLDCSKIRNDGFFCSKVHLRNDYYRVFGSFDSKLKGVKSFESRQISVPCGWWIKNL